ncbi:MAG: Rrf2 family transcriptional regulator [Candidatus Atribacteria bacterium]|nr:Rrf2 family transcriptional regulator [Candidatus Atribacteria bacterium]
MKISTRLRYGLRLLLDLALHAENEPIPLKDVAERQNISLHYLRQLTLPLEASGIIRSMRGNRGGYVLGRSPEKISLLEVAQVLEGPLYLTECVNDASSCNQFPKCRTRKVWAELSSAIQKILAQKNLRDLVEERSENIDLPGL